MYPRTFTITSSPYYDRCSQQYQNILMLNIEPEGPLRAFVRRLRLPRLTPYQTEKSEETCGLVLTNFLNNQNYYNNNQNKNNNWLMTPNDIPDLYSFLTANGYQIDTQLTNMMNQSQVKLTPGKQIVCLATYFGDKQPNIVYMK
jgi:hypothetical protein